MLTCFGVVKKSTYGFQVRSACRSSSTSGLKRGINWNLVRSFGRWSGSTDDITLAPPKRPLAAILMLFLLLVPSAGLAQCTTGEIVQGQQDSGAYYRIYMPDQQCWNQNLVLFSHGFVAPVLPVGIPEGHLVLPDGTNVPQMVNGLGFAFAVTSFSTNGLAVPEALADLEDLVAIFSERFGAPTKTYLNGVSQGGLITTLALEKYPHLYDGGVAVCGPVGDFLDILITCHQDRRAAKRFFCKVLKHQKRRPWQLVIDKLRSYLVALRNEQPDCVPIRAFVAEFTA